MNQSTENVGMYIIDKEYHILNCNKAMQKMYPEVKVGDICYKALALGDSPCPTCPLAHNDVLFFNHYRKEWITANVAEIEYPGYGECYNIQFKMQKNIGGTKNELISMENVDEHLFELKSNVAAECVLGAYCEDGAPLFYANENMVKFLGYDSLEDMLDGIDGVVDNIIHPQDKESVHQSVVDDLSAGRNFETFFRMHMKEGSWTWTVARGKIVETESGRKATLAVCSSMDNFLRIHGSLQEKADELLQDKKVTQVLMDRIPGGYHRCMAAEGYPFLLISESFEKITGWTKEEIETEFDNKFVNMVWPEDHHLFENLVEQIDDAGQGSVVYRMKKKGGGYRWVQDSTMYVEAGEEGFFQCTLSDITEYITGLEEEKIRAEASNRAKSAFLFNASHDIRTPMNAIQGFTQILKKNADDGQVVREIVAKIEKSGDMLMKLLNNVLELSRIESGKETVEPEPTDMEELSGKLKTMLMEKIESAGITFELVNNITDKFVFCDELKIMQIGMNMISNAKKFTPEGGSITFGIEQTPAEEAGYAKYRFYVRDTGIGMSEEFLARAFEQFERERTTTESGVIGSGLGLSIIKKMTELMGGTCTLQSKLGEGTEISSIVKLKLAQESDFAEPVSQKTVDITDKRILLVEDNDFNREIGRFVLENMGVIVEEAENGAVALDMLRAAGAGYFDLVLMDIQMPVMDGYTATQEIRHMEDKALAEIPIIAMTANAFKEDRDRCLAEGMNEHIGKPIDEAALLEVISTIIL